MSVPLGGPGKDLLVGGDGPDGFVFQYSCGADVVHQYDASEEQDGGPDQFCVKNRHGEDCDCFGDGCPVANECGSCSISGSGPYFLKCFGQKLAVISSTSTAGAIAASFNTDGCKFQFAIL